MELDYIKKNIPPEQWEHMGKRTYHRGDESHWDYCPNCKKGVDRLHTFRSRKGVWTWYCNKCGNTGSVIDWYMTLYGIDFGESLRRIKIAHGFVLSRNTANEPVHDTQVTESFELPSIAWRESLLPLVRHWNEWLCREMDAGEYTEYARGYLVDRGLRSIPMLQRHLIGVNPNSRTLQISDGGMVNIPRGITIPRFHDGELCGIRIRSYPTAGRKYTAVSESVFKTLYNASRVTVGCDVVIVEGEFDVLAVESVTDEVVPVSMGSSKNPLRPWDIDILSKARSIRIIGDNDKGGQDGAEESLSALSHHPNVALCHYPSGYKDANEILQRDPQLLRDCLSEWFVCW